MSLAPSIVQRSDTRWQAGLTRHRRSDWGRMGYRHRSVMGHVAHGVLGASVAIAATRGLFAQTAPNQRIAPIDPRPACSDCRIRLTHVATLGTDTGDAAIPGQPIHYALDSRGRIFLTFMRDRPLVFDLKGRFLRVLAGIGRGPAEVGPGSLINVGRGDTIFAFDEGNARITFFDPDFRLVNSHPLGTAGGSGMLQLGNGTFVQANVFRDPEKIGYALRLLRRDGEVLRYIGLPADRVDLSRESALNRSLTPRATKTFWVAHELTYTLQQYDEQGRLIQTLREQPDWFVEAGPHGVMVVPGKSPPSVVLGVYEHHDGMLWVSAQAARADWQAGVGKPYKGRAAFVYLPTPDVTLVWENVIEVIDPRSKQVVSTTRVPGTRLHFLGDGLVAGYAPDETGRPRVKIWRVQIDNRTRSTRFTPYQAVRRSGSRMTSAP
jgi:hypothetical protein